MHLLVTYLVSVLSLTAVTYEHPGNFGHCAGFASHLQRTCCQIAAAVSNASDVYFPCMRSLLSKRARAELEIKLIHNMSPIFFMSIRLALSSPLAQWSPARRKM